MVQWGWYGNIVETCYRSRASLSVYQNELAADGPLAIRVKNGC